MTDNPAPSRRVLLRGAATTAWAVPVVVAVGAAPAHAASPTPADISTNLVPPVRAGSTMPISATLTNGGAQPSVNLRVTVRVEIPSAQTMVGVTCSTPNGYSFVSTVYASNTVVLHTFLAGTQVPGNGAAAFSATVTIGSTGSLNPVGTVQVIPAVDAPGSATPSTVQSYV